MAKVIDFKSYQRNASGKVEKKPECNCISCTASRMGFEVVEIATFEFPANIGELTLAELVLRRAREIHAERNKEKDKGPIDT